MEEALSRGDTRAMPRDAMATLLDCAKPVTAATELVPKPYLFLLSANDPKSLVKSAALVAEYLFERPEVLYPDLFRSLAFTLGQRRTSHPWRIALQATSHDELIHKLKDEALTPTRSVEQPRIGFVFTGQGSQWPKMGTELYHAYPTYASAIQKVDHILTSLGASWSLLAELEKSEGCSIIDNPNISQPACTALQIALVDLFHSWGITAHSVTGHSSGEIAAAYAAGILGVESCVAIAYYRGLVASSLLEKAGGISGGMLAVGASQHDTQTLIDARTDVVGECTIACINSPKSMTVSGDGARIAQVSALADSQSIWNKRLKVNVAYHSHHMNAVAQEYASLLGEVKPIRDARIEFHSSLQGQKVEPGALDTLYWIRNLTSPVRFSEAFTSLCEPKEDRKRGVDLVIEIGPHSTLQGPIRQITQTFEGRTREIQSFPSVVRNVDSTSSLLDLSARLEINGCTLHLGNINCPASASAPDLLSDLPPYPWNHTQKYWHEPRELEETLKYSCPRHDLLGNRESDCSVEAPRWKNVLTVEDVPWLRDHRVQDVIIFPITGYLCMAMEACQQQARWKDKTFDRITLKNISAHRPLALPELTPIELRLSLTPWTEGSYSLSDTWSQFRISSWVSDRGWLDHCSGLVGAILPEQQNPFKLEGSRVGLEHQMGDLLELRSRCKEILNPKDMYSVCDDSGFHYGPMFRQIQEAQLGSSHEGAFTMSLSDTLTCMPYSRQSDYLIHPTSLDNVLQGSLVFLAHDPNVTEGPWVPTSIGEITVAVGLAGDPGSTYQIHGRYRPYDPFSKRATFDFVVLDTQRDLHPCGIVVKGLVEALVPNDHTAEEEITSRCLRIQWEPSMSYLDENSSDAILTLPPRFCNPQASQEVEDMGLDYIKEALRQTTFDEIPATYLQDLYAWMKTRLSEVNGDVTIGKAQGPNGNVSKIDTDERNGDAANDQVSVGSIYNTSNGKVDHRQLTNEKGPDGEIFMSKVHNQPNGALANGQTPETKISNLDTHKGSIRSHDNALDGHAKSPQLAVSLMRRIGAQLPAILRGTIDPKALVSEDDLLSRFTAEFEGRSRLYCAAATYVQKLAFQSPVLRVLQLGEHDALATAAILDSLSKTFGISSESVKYEIVASSTNITASLAPWRHMLKHRELDPAKPWSSLDLEKGTYDVIILADNHKSRKPKLLIDVHALLKTGGRLILFQNRRNRNSTSLLPLATLPDWWVEDGDDCKDSANSKTTSIPRLYRDIHLTRYCDRL